MAVSEGGRRRGRGGGGLNAWPGYVDALSTLLMVIIFVLLVFVLAQGFLSVALSSRDQALDRLNRQVTELADMLALERGQVETLRATLTRTAEELQGATAARDALALQLREAREERDRLGAERDGTRAERDRLAARLTDLELAARGGAERLATLESQLAQAMRRAEAAGGDTAQALQRLTETGRTLSGEQQARRQAETRIAELDRALAESRGATETARREAAALQRSLSEAQAQLAETQRQVAALRQEAATLDRQVQADRATIEARLADLARLTQEIRALTALRDQLERQAREAMARAGEEQRRREAAERGAAEQQAARTAAERAAAEQAAQRQAADRAAAEQARLREAADRAAAEQARLREAAQAATAERDRQRTAAEARAAEAGRLGESARAQVALLTRQLDELRAQLARIAAALDAAEDAGRDKDAQIANLGSRLNAALAARVEELQRYRSDFFGRLRDVLGERPEIRVVGDRFVFQSEVLFPPASAELSDRGQQQIREIARVLTEITRRIPPDVPWVLRVDGHADRNPIRSPRFASNWELSAARAIAVAQLLIAEGLPANRVAATAFGDNQPLDDRDTPEAYARNRRIELRRQQQPELHRVRLDLLAQAVDVRLQRVRGDGAVVAPDLVQQHLARHRPAAGPVEEFQDRAFLVGQADLAVARRLHQQLGRGAEQVGPDGEDRILGVVEDPKLRAHAGEQLVQAERLGDVVVRAGIEALHHILLGIGAGQHDDGHLLALPAELGAELAPVAIGQADIEQDRVVSRIGAGKLLLGLPRGLGLVGREITILRDLFRKRCTERGVILDNEDRARGCHAASGCVLVRRGASATDPDGKRHARDTSVRDRDARESTSRPRGMHYTILRPRLNQGVARIC